MANAMQLTAEFSRRLALAFQSPYWRYIFLTSSLEDYTNSQNATIAAATDAGEFDKLSQEMKDLILLAEKSVELAQQKGFSPPYNALSFENLTAINDALIAYRAAQAGGEVDASSLLP